MTGMGGRNRGDLRHDHGIRERPRKWQDTRSGNFGIYIQGVSKHEAAVDLHTAAGRVGMIDCVAQ